MLLEHHHAGTLAQVPNLCKSGKEGCALEAKRKVGKTLAGSSNNTRQSELVS